MAHNGSVENMLTKNKKKNKMIHWNYECKTN